MNMMKFSYILLLSVITGCLCEDNIVQLAGKLGANTLVQLVKAAGLADVLSSAGPFTVFGPTDEAFASLPPGVVDSLKKDHKLLAQVLEFHVLKGSVFSNQITDEGIVPTLNPAASIRTNIYPWFEPKLVTATGSPVVLADQKASNGVIHVISRVMFPLPTENLVATVAKNKDLMTLVKAVTLAKLVKTLSGPDPYTLFAPTNEAFEKLPAGFLEKLSKNITALTEVLTYHVIPLTYYSAGLKNLSVKTVEGNNVTIRVSPDGVKINQARVIVADQSVSNGVFHVIDSVLCPPEVCPSL
ncbi:protein sll1483-like [Mytilus edulis]|uniref:protein sll1483-like n=1 Tax=Mytilus edulis TaxID=6550 RepID=UPI0039EF3F27